MAHTSTRGLCEVLSLSSIQPWLFQYMYISHVFQSLAAVFSHSQTSQKHLTKPYDLPRCQYTLYTQSTYSYHRQTGRILQIVCSITLCLNRNLIGKHSTLEHTLLLWEGVFLPNITQLLICCVCQVSSSVQYEL